jgi:hypothetical protein
MTKFPNHCDEGIDFSGIAVIRWYEVPHWRLEARDEYFWFGQSSWVDNLRHDSSVPESRTSGGTGSVANAAFQPDASALTAFGTPLPPGAAG